MVRKIILGFLIILTIGAILYLFLGNNKNVAVEKKEFSGDSAYQFVLDQVNYGPRVPGSLSHQLTREYISQHLQEYGWTVDIQEKTVSGYQIINIIGKRGDSGEITVVGAHYDSRIHASAETTDSAQMLPVPGANDGASGVAVLLELARVLPPAKNGQLWLVFFDAEDQGHIDDREWIMGSRLFVQELAQKPSRAVIIDMIGDTDLQVFREHNSDPQMTDQLWQAAYDLGYSSYFIDQEKYNILDDHIPFIEAGIPAVDIIDFDYPWWHTLSDTVDKVSPQSLEIVGKTLIKWLESNP